LCLFEIANNCLNLKIIKSWWLYKNNK
jgi:hypothetical protein